jgi:glucose-6-phosphate dehydrogenase assembly protein OpcA
MSTTATELIGTEVPFGKIGEALARRTCQEAGATPMRALVATVVAVGPGNRLDRAAEVLQALGDAGTVRGILISEGTNPAPPARVAGNTVMLQGLKPAYVNNAVAALRLSSLPTLVWWRGGGPDTLDGLAELADRIVLDDEDAEGIWTRAVTLFDDSAFSDLRWARLTQWRALMAHFFDIPEVLAASRQFSRLEVHGRDRTSAALFAAWLTSSIELGDGFTVALEDGTKDCAIEQIRLSDHEQELMLKLAGRNCLETEVSVRGHRGASRVVSLVDQTLTGVLTEEIRFRARDLAFERAVNVLVKGQLPVQQRDTSTVNTERR